jgi:hypothetical protein
VLPAALRPLTLRQVVDGPVVITVASFASKLSSQQGENAVPL